MARKTGDAARGRSQAPLVHAPLMRFHPALAAALAAALAPLACAASPRVAARLDDTLVAGPR